jgi:hypothetical protein
MVIHMSQQSCLFDSPAVARRVLVPASAEAYRALRRAYDIASEPDEALARVLGEDEAPVMAASVSHEDLADIDAVVKIYSGWLTGAQRKAIRAFCADAQSALNR